MEITLRTEYKGHLRSLELTKVYAGLKHKMIERITLKLLQSEVKKQH